MKKEKEKKCTCEEECTCNKEHKCDETCTCGCQEGKECTCNETCECECCNHEKCECDDCNCEECDCDCCDCEEVDYEDIQKVIDDLSNQIVEEQNKCLRAQAELMNYKRRKDEEVSNFYKYANEDLIVKLLPTIDNFERALTMKVREEASDEINKYLEGFKMIYTNLIGLLNSLEVKEIEADGIEFNPTYHQAVLIEKDENKPSGVILEVLQKGYIYKDKVIRPSMVKVNE